MYEIIKSHKPHGYKLGFRHESLVLRGESSTGTWAGTVASDLPLEL